MLKSIILCDHFSFNDHFAAFVLTYFHPMKCRITFFRAETIVTSLLYLMALICKMFIDRSSKRPVAFFGRSISKKYATENEIILKRPFESPVQKTKRMKLPINNFFCQCVIFYIK